MSVIKPCHLVPGDRVAIVAPASSFHKRALLGAIDKLRWWGFDPVYRHGIFSQPPRPERYARKAQDIIDWLRDPSVAAIFCAEGGYGSQNLIPHLERCDLSEYPKIILGYSDITVLLLYFWQRYGWITFHGPTVAGHIYKGMPPPTEAALLAAITGEHYSKALTFGDLTVIRSGIARGRVIGGNLTRMMRTLGTKFEINTRGCILFIEEVDESYISIDGHLNHLQLAGKLDGLAGVVLSEMTGCMQGSRRRVMEYLKRFFRDADYPVLMDLASGHGVENLTLPIGARACLSSSERALTFLESPVR